MKILVVRLQSDSHKDAKCGSDFYQVVDETEENYEVDLALCNVFINNKKFIPKEETNRVKYTEVFSRIDDKEYWFVDAYVYATIQDDVESQGTIEYWKEQLQQAVMKSVKDRNQALKSLYYSIESL